MKKIAIIGDEGFIGSNLKKALENHAVENKVEFEVALFDLKRGEDFLDVQIPQSDVIFHLASQKKSDDVDMMHDAMTNIAGIIKLIKENPNAKIILATTKSFSSMIGEITANEISCKAEEMYLMKFQKEFIVAKIPECYGPGGNTFVEEYLKEDVCKVMSVAGENVRMYVHVADICNGLIQSMYWTSGVYEFGSAKAYTAHDLAKATGKQIELIPEEYKEGNIFAEYYMNDTPGWSPGFDVIDYIKGMIAYSKEKGNGIKQG